MRTVVVTGSASGLGAAHAEQVRAAGDRVIGVDIDDADVVADLGTAEGRTRAIDQVTEQAGNSIDGLACWAGLGGLTDRPGAPLVSVNFFGAIALLAGLRPLLARGDRPAALAVSSNSTTCQPGVPMDVVEHCMEGDEAAACAVADTAGSLATYPATKLALAWWTRRHAPTAEWAGAGIALNAIAPGPVETPLLQATRDDPVIGAFVDDFPIPMGRAAQPDEVAAVAQFLLGAEARFLCGSVVFADGGTDALLAPNAFPHPMAPG